MGAVRGYVSLAALAAFVLWPLPQSMAQSGAWGDGHAEMHHEYQGWKDNRGYSCCNDADCRPTRAYVGDDGAWHAWNGETWVYVPADAVLHIPSPDLSAHICMRPGALQPMCFVPGPVLR